MPFGLSTALRFFTMLLKLQKISRKKPLVWIETRTIKMTPSQVTDIRFGNPKKETALSSTCPNFNYQYKCFLEAQCMCNNNRINIIDIFINNTDFNSKNNHIDNNHTKYNNNSDINNSINNNSISYIDNNNHRPINTFQIQSRLDESAEIQK
ncbi:hypothetical protein ACTFIR_003903 [Dictyostelium discoideum]